MDSNYTYRRSRALPWTRLNLAFAPLMLELKIRWGLIFIPTQIRLLRFGYIRNICTLGAVIVSGAATPGMRQKKIIIGNILMLPIILGISHVSGCSQCRQRRNTSLLRYHLSGRIFPRIFPATWRKSLRFVRLWISTVCE